MPYSPLGLGFLIGGVDFTRASGPHDARGSFAGGNSGIGRAIAIAYAREGADMALSYLPRSRLTPKSPRNGSAKPAGRPCCCPVTSNRPKQCRDIVAQTLEAFGGIDLLVNNAAVSEGCT